MKSTDRSAEPSCTESSMASTDLRADLERHQNGHDTKRLYVLDFCTVCELAWPCDAARALAALDEAEAEFKRLRMHLQEIADWGCSQDVDGDFCAQSMPQDRDDWCGPCIAREALALTPTTSENPQ